MFPIEIDLIHVWQLYRPVIRYQPIDLHCTGMTIKRFYQVVSGPVGWREIVASGVLKLIKKRIEIYKITSLFNK